jgi:hypothetical protein
VLHNGVLTPADRRTVAVVNCGPRAVLTSFTAAAAFGLTGWERREVHVLAPPGTAGLGRRLGFVVVLHRSRRWSAVATDPRRRLHRPAPALLIAAGSWGSPRLACGLLAAAVEDISQGAQALSEIDFARLCRRAAAPSPSRWTARCTWRLAAGGVISCARTS